MAEPRVLILRAPGTNCDHETAFAFERAGASTESVHVNELLADAKKTAAFQILCIPGGFSYGDDIAAGRILGNQLRHHLSDRLAEFKAAEKLILGICNGFQVLAKSGILLASDQGIPLATLTFNDSGKFEDRWVRLSVADASRCVFLRGIESLELPVAHAEGKFVARDASTLARFSESGQLVLRYAASKTRTARGANGRVEFPDNPNGSEANVAGACDESGRVFGLMPHPERYIERTHHPRWTRGEGRDPGDGMAVFENAVRYFR
jgi:phosphoribosylformylglycinamidine synthase